jgi:hypothetical protein
MPLQDPLAKRKLIEVELSSLLDMGIICPSSSPYSAPLLMVPKKDGTQRMCIDYRRLNLVTKMDRHPLPLIQDIFDQLGGAAIFTTLDLKQGYHQLPVAPESVEKTAFACHAGIFEWVRMPMGVACGPPVFQREMQRTLAGLLGVCALVYLDDLIIYSKDMSSHLTHRTEVFARLRGADLTLKREKCTR